MYLKDREQLVEVRNCRSSARQVTSGVPQGSVLGPLLFFIYASDMIDVIPANVPIRLYADDSVIFKKIVSHDDHDVLQRYLVASLTGVRIGECSSMRKNRTFTRNKKKISQ